MNRDTEIRKACAKVATAMAQLIDAVRLPLLTENVGQSSAPLELPDDSKIDAASKPADRRSFVYCAGCAGLATLARAHGTKIAGALGVAKPYITKCGTTAVDLPTRLRQIGKDRYGAAVRTSDGIETQAGFEAWVAHAIATSRESHDPAVRVLARAIAVDRPLGMTSREFDNALHRALRSRALDTLPASTWPRRFGCYDLVGTRHSRAKEIYALCPYAAEDGDLLLTAIEGVLQRFRDRRAKAA